MLGLETCTMAMYAADQIMMYGQHLSYQQNGANPIEHNNTQYDVR